MTGSEGPFSKADMFDSEMTTWTRRKAAEYGLPVEKVRIPARTFDVGQTVLAESGHVAVITAVHAPEYRWLYHEISYDVRYTDGETATIPQRELRAWPVG